MNNDRTPVVISYAATRVGRLEQARFEHEILSDLVINAVRSAGLDKADIGSAVFTAPAPTTRQRAFATFMLSRLGLRCHGQAAEVSNLGITGGLAFDQACADVRSGRVKAALALGIEYNSGVDAATMMESAIRASGDVNFQAPFGLTPIAWYALDADRYLFETGATRRDLAAIAVKSRGTGLMALQKDEIRRLLERLNDELARAGITGELYLVGGAVMCLAFNARPSTRDLDGFFKPARAVRAAAKRVSATLGLDDNWLNDTVKGYLGNQGDFQDYLDLSNLRVMIAGPEYLLAMKCLALRLGEEFHDEADVRFLLRYLNITNYRKALDIICQYYPLERFPQKTLYALEEMADDLVPD